MEFKLDSKIYSLEAILNACYAFIERAYIFLDSDTNRGKISVSLKGKLKLSSRKLEQLRGEFMNELLCCALRYEISKKNKKIREYIIGRALYSALPAADLVTSTGKSDYQEDPLGIAIPWEEKYGKKKNAKNLKV